MVSNYFYMSAKFMFSEPKEKQEKMDCILEGPSTEATTFQPFPIPVTDSLNITLSCIDEFDHEDFLTDLLDQQSTPNLNVSPQRGEDIDDGIYFSASRSNPEDVPLPQLEQTPFTTQAQCSTYQISPPTFTPNYNETIPSILCPSHPQSPSNASSEQLFTSTENRSQTTTFGHCKVIQPAAVSRFEETESSRQFPFASNPQISPFEQSFPYEKPFAHSPEREIAPFSEACGQIPPQQQMFYNSKQCITQNCLYQLAPGRSFEEKWTETTYEQHPGMYILGVKTLQWRAMILRMFISTKL